MSSRATTSTTLQSRRHRSRSQSRYVEVEKPKKKKTTSSNSLVSIPNQIKLSMLNSGLLSFDKVKLSVKDENNPLSQTIPDAPTELKFFIKLCQQRKKFPVLYKIEFTTAVETNSCRHATKKNNLEKNQNQKTVPYDYNRVVLQKLSGVSDSDYINASRVDSLLKPNAYIVSQGPSEETVFDFWRLVWQENVSCIVMLTKTFDFTKVMCVQYWPASKDKDECYGELPEYQIHIGVMKEEELANFHIRTFRIYKMHNNVKTEERVLLQFHYTEWPSHACPFSNALLEFRRRVRSVVGNTLKSSRPMLVHCNDGGGRSGVFLAVDANIELAEEEDSFYVFGYLKKLRQSRKGLIEIVDQYKFVYDTLEEYVTCGNTFFPVKDLSQKLKQKGIKDPVTKLNEYQREYAQICKQTPRFSIGDCAGGHRGDNREKNRDVLCVPPDNFRPYLTSFQGNAFTDYINSVFIDGYTKPREYIVTEWPLKTTCGEFWSLVYDHECSAVVVLCQPPHNSQTYPNFWPEGRHSKKYGPVFTLDHLSHNHYSNIKTWIFRINKKVISLTELMAGVKAVPRTVQLFQLTCWPMGHKVPTSTNSLVELMNMVERWRQKTIGPVCIVSPDGRSRAGVYCAANACIEQVIQHSEVDVFQAVKTVRRHRPQLVDNMTEYKYCYDLVLHYVLHYLNKENEKKFIDFGRGKNLPLTPDNDNLDQIRIKSNTGRIIVDKTFTDLDFKTCILSNINKQQYESGGSRYVIDKEGNIVERKKKHRLCSLGGNEPSLRKQSLVRMKTVGTLDLCMEVTALACAGFNQGGKSTTPTSAEPTVIIEKKSSEPSLDNDKTILTSISPKRQRNNISSSENSINVDDNNLLSSNVKKKKFRSLSTNSYLEISRNSDKCKSAELLKQDDSLKSDFRINKSVDNLTTANIDEVVKTSDDDEFVKSSNPLSARRRTLKKSKKIIRTDSELFHDKVLMQDLESSAAKTSGQASKTNSVDSSKNMSTDTVFSDMGEEEDELQNRIDLERLENEYKEHVRSNLQREYKSDGDSLDEVGKERSYDSEWKNQSVDFDFLETRDDDFTVKSILRKHTISAISVHEEETTLARQYSVDTAKSPRKDSGKRTKSEGDKDAICVEKSDSVETQSTTEDENNKNEGSEQKELSKPLSLFERRFGKLRKMNKLLKVKRFSTSALYDNINKKKNDSNASSYNSKNNSNDSNKQQQTKGDQIQSTPHSLLSQVSDFTSSKMSLSSPKSLKGGKKVFTLKKRKFSFFGKSQSNNDINLNLKSIASKLSLLSKSNFDLSTRNSSNLRLNAMGIYGKYGSSNEYRSDIITSHEHGCTSPLSEAFYNATGSYQLTPMELFEKFCSQDFTGLYKHETLMEEECDDKLTNYDTGQYKGAIKKTTGSSLRKTTLLKQNSEPKFGLKNYSSSDYYNPPDAFEEEDLESIESEEYEFNSMERRRSSYTRQQQVDFDQNDQYFEEDDSSVDDLYRNIITDEDVIDEIYLMPEKEIMPSQRYDTHFMRSSEEILAIDETDEEGLEEEMQSDDSVDQKHQLLALYEICPKDDENDGGGCSDEEEIITLEERDDNLKIIISEYVKNACSSAAADGTFSRSKSMDLLSNSSETLKTHSNSEYAFDTVKQINLDSCSTSRLSLSLNSDIFDDITLAVPEAPIKTIKISEIDDFTITPDGSIKSEGKIAALSQMSEQERIKNELQSQYTIIDCDELEHDDENGSGMPTFVSSGDVDEMRRFNDEKSSFAEALNKEFDKLFSRAKNDSDTDITTTPSVATTVLTAIKLPSRCSMEKLEPFEFDYDDNNIIGGISEENPEQSSMKLLSQSMTSTTLRDQSISLKREEALGGSGSKSSKSKRSHSLGAINKKKSNKCNPL